METTRNEMSPYAKHFFNSLSNYLDTKIYYYGSIQRPDYFPKFSDIDVDIFTDNESSTISRLKTFLNVDNYKVVNIAYELHKSNKLIFGHKVVYTDRDNHFSTEISIYSEKYKDAVLYEHNFKQQLPFYVLYPLIFVKMLYYNHIIPHNIYKKIKRFLMNNMIEGKDVDFVPTDLPFD
jgi:hypothetical protein